MTKRILSVAAAAAIMTSGAYAFDTNTAGEILTQNGVLGAYDWDANVNKNNTRDLRPSLNGKGDALMFPLFTQEGNWGTEMVVRNNTNKGVVAKVVVHAADDSREVKDFNIYLTANDVFRFKIENGKLTSTDDSVVVNESYNDDTVHEFASPSKPFVLDVKDVNGKAVQNGYVVVLGMGQNKGSYKPAGWTTDGFHHNQGGLFEVYRNNLTKTRPQWRDQNSWTHGVYTKKSDPIIVPNIKEWSAVTSFNPSLCEDGNVTVECSSNGLYDLDDDALSGQVRIYNATDVTRDMLLNAITADRYTHEGVMLWAPGEYASWNDRALDEVLNSDCVGTPVGAPTVTYDCGQVGDDASRFTVGYAYYTYANGSANPSVENKMIVTQPHKRTMVQLGGDDNDWAYTDFWSGVCDFVEPEGKPITGKSIGFSAHLDIWDEEENKDLASGQITSPISGGAHCTEITVLTDLEDGATADYSDKNGYVVVNFDGSYGLPAIITQQTASMVGGDSHINWVPSIVFRPTI